MKKFAKYLAALCAVALFGAALAGCAAQQSAPAAPTKEDLIAELQGICDKEDYKSATLEMKGDVKIDYAALLGDALGGDEAASAEAASAEAASAEAASAEAADAGASGEAAEDESTSMPFDITAKYDMSGDALKMYMTMNMLGMNMEIYLNGQDAVVVIAGQAMSASLKELGMEQYASMDSLTKSQGVNIDAVKDAITSIEKSTEGQDTVYKVVFDPKKFAQTNEQVQGVAQMAGDDMLQSVEATYKVGADGRISGIDMTISGKGYSSTMTFKLYDYDSTTVPDAPEATVSYSDAMGALGDLGDLGSSIEGLVEDAASGESASAKEAKAA